MYFFHSINGIEIPGVGIFNGETFHLGNLIKDLEAFQKEGKGEFGKEGAITGEEIGKLLGGVNRYPECE